MINLLGTGDYIDAINNLMSSLWAKTNKMADKYKKDVVPALQKLGVVRARYEHVRLRDNLLAF